VAAHFIDQELDGTRVAVLDVLGELDGICVKGKAHRRIEVRCRGTLNNLAISMQPEGE